MLLGIEIGGTKLQLGVGSGDGGKLVALERLEVVPSSGGEGIRRQIAPLAELLIKRHNVTAIGIGFGGPVDATTGRTIISCHVDGWNDFPLADWCRKQFNLPTAVINDSNSAGLAEARFGAGRGHKVVFYTNVGSGIGGALVIDGEVYYGGSGTAVEPGQLRPGMEFNRPDQTVESIASGWGITAAVKAQLIDHQSRPLQPPIEQDVVDLLERCDGQLEQLTTKIIAESAKHGNRIALRAFDRACQTFGWAIAQVVTLMAPNIVVVGGGVSMVGEKLLYEPVRKYVSRYVFPPLENSFKIVQSELGEEVVIHGALAMAQQQTKEL